MDKIVCEMWVCLCCMLTHANGECCSSDEHGGDGVKPLSEVDFAGGFSVTMGLLAEEHHEGLHGGDPADQRV